MVRVLIISARRLFGEGLEAWLRQQKGLDVIGWEPETGRAVERIRDLKPDVIILDTSASAKDPVAALMRFLSERSSCQIIGLDLQNNSVSMCGGEELAIDRVRELLEVAREQGAGLGPPYPQGATPESRMDDWLEAAEASVV